MFCPSCRDEFQPGYSRCPDCEVALVVRLPGPEDGTEAAPLSDDPILIFETESQSIGSIVKTILESSGIPFGTENLSPTAWGQASAGLNPVGPIRVFVPRDREQEARALLTENPLPAEQDVPAGEPAEEDLGEPPAR